MAVLAISRIVPQDVVAIQVWTSNAQDIVGLFAALLPYGYTTNSQTDPGFPGYWRLSISDQVRKEPQMAYPGEYLLVTDATYNGGTNEWSVSHKTDVIVYGVSSGQLNVADFVGAFTVNMALAWMAMSSGAAPVAIEIGSSSATLSFFEPTSANGSFTYTLTGPGTAGEFTTDPTGKVSTTITGLTPGAQCSWTVTVSTQYEGVTATSAVSNTITAT